MKKSNPSRKSTSPSLQSGHSTSSPKKKIVKKNSNGEKTIRIRTNANYKLGDGPKDYEPDCSMPSEVRPGMTDNLMDMVNRLVQGREVPLNQDPYYHGDLPEIDKMDKTDIEMYKRSVYEFIAQKESEIKDLKQQGKNDYQKHRESEIQRLQALVNSTKKGTLNSNPEE